MIVKYICDKEKHIKKGLCEGSKPECLNGGSCYMTTQKKYAKEYIDIYEAAKWFSEEVAWYISIGDKEKAEQYENALKGVHQAMADIQSQHPEGKVVGYLLPQPDEGMEGMVSLFDGSEQHIFR